jgi:hypothetical protein
MPRSGARSALIGTAIGPPVGSYVKVFWANRPLGDNDFLFFLEPLHHFRR